MRKGIFYFLMVAIVLGISFYGFSGSEGSQTILNIFRGTVEQKRQIATVRIGSASVGAEVAATDALRRKGLSGRDALGENEGMLFVFDQPGPHAFWMAGMKFPLDIIWISNGEVVDVAIDVPVPSDTPKLYSPKAFATHVLEVNAGFAARHEIRVGSPVSITY